MSLGKCTYPAAIPIPARGAALQGMQQKLVIGANTVLPEGCNRELAIEQGYLASARKHPPECTQYCNPGSLKCFSRMVFFLPAFGSLLLTEMLTPGKDGRSSRAVIRGRESGSRVNGGAAPGEQLKNPRAQERGEAVMAKALRGCG